VVFYFSVSYLTRDMNAFAKLNAEIRLVYVISCK
jgi:hypothetical protein